jgi:hypothetical protein
VRRGIVSAILSVASLLLLATPGLLRAATAAPATPRLVVKYRPSVDACAHYLLKRGVPFQTLTDTSSLDTLNHDLGVTRARAVFFISGTRAA